MIDFGLPPALVELQSQVRRFIAEQLMPLESDPRQGAHGPDPALRAEMVELARRAAPTPALVPALGDRARCAVNGGSP